MKKMIFILFWLSGATSFAASIAKECYSKSESSVAQSVSQNDYDEDGFSAYKCEVAKNNSAILCEVSASKGDGAAIDTYRVVLNKSCSHTFRIDLIGEE